MEDRGEVYVKWEQMLAHMFAKILHLRNLYPHLYDSIMYIMSITKKCGLYGNEEVYANVEFERQ